MAVRVEKNGGAWVLTRDGAPYFIKGAGGHEHLELLRACGGNSIRTWGTDGAGPVLDQAHALGLSVTVGLWLQHERHGFDYAAPRQVDRQFATARRHVLQYKDHPALLLWGIGNEMEGAGENPLVWRHVNEIARMIRELDPVHPTMTVIADTNPVKIDALKAHCPDVDILGINAYGGLPTLPERLAEYGCDRPWIVTEFGPKGWWEVRKTDWGAEIEPTSAEKAEFYLGNYRHAIEGQIGRCLGSYVFKWGFKQEHTATWFSMLSDSGLRYPTVDAMSAAWSGRWPRTRCPVIRALASAAVERRLKRGEEHRVTVDVAPDGGAAFTCRWEIREESSDKKEGGDAENAPRAVDGCIVANGGDSATFRAPARPGAYRFYVYVHGPDDAVAAANFPFYVEE